MAYAEPPLPLDLKSDLTIALEQIQWSVTNWLAAYAGATAVVHPGVVDQAFLRQQSGRSIRSVISHSTGNAIRYAGGASTTTETKFHWFLVIPGTIQNRTIDATTIVGEAMRLVVANPWRDIEAAKASGTARFTGTAGVPVPLGQVVERNDGAQYATTAADVIGPGGSVDIPIEALEDGTEDNTRVAQVALAAIAPPAGVDAKVVVLEPGLAGGQYATTFCKTPVADSMKYRSLYKTTDEKNALTIWMIQWLQEVELGTGQRMRTPAPGLLETVESTSTVPSTPNDDEFTQIVEQ